MQGGAGPIEKPQPSFSPKSVKKNFVARNKRAYVSGSRDGSGSLDDKERQNERNADGTGGSGETPHARAIIPQYLQKDNMARQRNNVLRQIEE